MTKRRKRWLVPVFFLGLTTLLLLLMPYFTTKTPFLVKGDIILDETLVGDAKDLRTLFIVVYPADEKKEGMPSMPIGAFKHTFSQRAEGEFYHFNLTKETLSLMNPNAEMPQVLKLKARLDTTGQGGPDKPGDLVGVLDNVPLGSKHIKIKIQTKI